MKEDNITYDYAIVGAGIIGLTIAFELINKNSNLNIAIIEKESEVALHASGRNSGIIHAGFYYSEDSLKAKLTVTGNSLMKEFCSENKIQVLNSEKLVVAQSNNELNTLDELYQRGLNNGVNILKITESEAKEIEPCVKTYKNALYTKSTASVDPKLVATKLKEILKSKHVSFFFNTKLKSVNKTTLFTNKETLNFKFLINSAGLYADKIAHLYDIGKEFTVIPFKGLYLKYKGNKSQLKTNIYPVPNLLNPFLGVHFTILSNGCVKIGPTAIPAFWRENYKKFDNFNFKECAEILFCELSMFYNNHNNFRDISFHEIKKYWKPYLIKEALKLANFDKHNFEESSPGIRAQLYNKQTKKLEMDFILKQKDNSLHVLNSVSPAFTCSFAIAKHIVNGL